MLGARRSGVSRMWYTVSEHRILQQRRFGAPTRSALFNFNNFISLLSVRSNKRKCFTLWLAHECLTER